jgi:hypothetical protein
MKLQKGELRGTVTTVTSTTAGGQHSPSVGDSTLHHEDPYDFSIGLKRAGEMFDVDSAPNREPEVDPGWLAEFERELNRCIGQFDVRF